MVMKAAALVTPDILTIFPSQLDELLERWKIIRLIAFARNSHECSCMEYYTCILIWGHWNVVIIKL